MKPQTTLFFPVLIGVLFLPLSQSAMAASINGTGLPISHPTLAGGAVIDFSSHTSGHASPSLSYTDVEISGNNVLRITDSFNGMFNMTGKCMALTSNDRTQEVTFTFSTPVDAFGFNLGGTDSPWHLVAYSAANDIVGERTIAPFGNSNNGEWFGIASSGITAARLYNTEFDVLNNTGITDYVVLDNFTYATPVPEPSTCILTGLGLVGLSLSARKRRG